MRIGSNPASVPETAHTIPAKRAGQAALPAGKPWALVRWDGVDPWFPAVAFHKQASKGLGSSSRYGREDGIGALVPDERLRVLVMAIKVIADRLFQIGNAGRGAALDPLLADRAKEALNRVESRGRRGRDVDVVARMGSQPCAQLLSLVRARAVHDQVDLSGAAANAVYALATPSVASSIQHIATICQP